MCRTRLLFESPMRLARERGIEPSISVIELKNAVIPYKHSAEQKARFE